MPHDLSLITTISVSFAMAFVFGMIANRLRLPPLVGYLVAGVMIGKFTPGFVADTHLAGQLAEIGVMLLMFGVGLHFSLADLMAVRKIAVPGAIGQIVLATLVGVVLTKFWGWTLGEGIVLGLSLSVASTVVLLKALEERNAVSTPNGRIAVGWLIVEDLAMVLALVLVPAFAEVLGGHAIADAHGYAGGGDHNLIASLAMTLAKVVAFGAIILFFGPKVLPWLLRQVARTGSRELFTLSVLAAAIGIAYGSAKLFGVSFALGAFFAGMVLNESDFSHRAAENSLPLQDAFAVLFFVSVGMLFDPSVLIHQPLKVLAVLALILIGKSIIAFGIVVILKYPIGTALMVSASLAQVGEFSFILAGLGTAHGLLPEEGLSLILAGAILSITLNPMMFALSEKATAWFAKKPSGTFGSKAFAHLQEELVLAREKAEQKAAARKTFTPAELVQRFPLFSGLTEEQRELLILHFQPKEARPSDHIIRKGDDAGDGVYFISEGEVEVHVGKKRIKLRGGDYFGEMALISGQPRSADVIAVDFSKFLILSQRDFREFLRRCPELREKVAALAHERQEMNRQSLESEAAPVV